MASQDFQEAEELAVELSEKSSILFLPLGKKR